MISITPIVDEVKRKCSVFYGRVYAYAQLEEIEDSTDYPIAVIYQGTEEVLPNEVIGNITQYYSNNIVVNIACKTEEQFITAADQLKDTLIGWKAYGERYSAIEYGGGNFANMAGDIFYWEMNFIVTSFQTRAKRTN